MTGSRSIGLLQCVRTQRATAQPAAPGCAPTKKYPSVATPFELYRDKVVLVFHNYRMKPNYRVTFCNTQTQLFRVTETVVVKQTNIEVDGGQTLGSATYSSTRGDSEGENSHAATTAPQSITIRLTARQRAALRPTIQSVRWRCLTVKM